MEHGVDVLVPHCVLLGLAWPLLEELAVLQALTEFDVVGEVEADPVGDKLALGEKEALTVAHGVGVRVPHWVVLGLATPLALAVAEGESVKVAEEERLGDAEPHCEGEELCVDVGTAEAEGVPEPCRAPAAAPPEALGLPEAL